MDDTLCKNTLDEIGAVKSFIELERLYHSWIEDGSIEAKKEFLPMGYSLLITQPNIILHDGVAEIKSARECQRIMMEYARETLGRLMTYEDEKNKKMASLLIIPPAKALLFECKTFCQLDKLITIETQGLTDEEIAELDGDYYASVWTNIAKSGLTDEDDLKSIPLQMGGSAFNIRKMHLSDETQALMDEKHFEEYSNVFFKEKGTAGCFSVITILIIMVAFSVIL